MLARIDELFAADHELEAQLTELVQEQCPQLLAEYGCGTVTAAIIIGHTAGADRFPTDACFARHTGTAPIPASSGNTTRHRLHRGGDRQLNRAIHIIALCRARRDPATRAYLAAQTRRRENQTRGTPLPQTPPRPTHLAHPLRHRNNTPPVADPDDERDQRHRTRADALRQMKSANSVNRLT